MRSNIPPKVSVVIPLFNKANHLGECLESVSGQSLRDIEIICVDDCSTDGSFEIAVQYARRDERVIVLRHDENRGPGSARNLGLERAVAPFVQFTDADDVLPAQSLENLLTLAMQDGVSIVRGSLGNFSDTPDTVWYDESQMMPDTHKLPLKGQKQLWIPYFHVCYMFAREFLAANQISYPRLRCGEDPIFLASALVKAPFISTTSAVCYLYRRSAPQGRRTFYHVMDFIRHVHAVKKIYTSSPNTQCWVELCEKFYLDDTKRFVSAVALNADEHAAVITAMREIWHFSAEAPGIRVDVGDHNGI
jgi:glycosyltransferase involved in cell wall biosynthesis